jgi:hypothetical protein
MSTCLINALPQRLGIIFYSFLKDYINNFMRFFAPFDPHEAGSNYPYSLTLMQYLIAFWGPGSSF